MDSNKLIEKIHVQIIKHDNGCWIWKGMLRNGYPSIKVRNKTTTVGRLLWMISNNRALNKHSHVRLSCGNKLCVNPDHILVPNPTLSKAERRKEGENIQNEEFEKLSKSISDRVKNYSQEYILKLTKKYYDSYGNNNVNNFLKKHNLTKADIYFIINNKWPWKQ